jgi:chromosome segregation ATPase
MRGKGQQMTITTHTPAAPGTPAGSTCRYPGCVNPARVKDRAAPGPRPGYCEQEVPEEHPDRTPVLVRHTALSAFRRRQQLAGQPGSDQPVTAAISRAAAIRDDALAAMTRLGAQLAAAIDQLAVLGEQLAAVGDPEAGEAQAEAVRAEAAAQTGQARAEAAAAACARHAAELSAAEAREAAAQAIAVMEAEALARQDAEAAAYDAAQALHREREAAAARIAEAGAAAAAASAERDQALDSAARQREQDQQRHDTALAAAAAQHTAAAGTITMLREQLSRAETALDRERAEQHRLATHLHDLLTSGQPLPAPAPAARTRAGAAPKETR